MNDDEFLTQLRAELLDAAERLYGPAAQWSPADQESPDGRAATPGREASADLDQARERRRRRRLRRATWFAIAAAALVGVLSVAFVAFDSDPAVAEIEVIRRDGFVFLRLVDLNNRADDIEAAAEQAGLDLTVTEVPVGPSNVGKFVSLDAAELPPAIEPTFRSGATFLGFRIPDDWKDEVQLTLGRAAEPGEPWDATSDALAKGEALECLDLVGESAAEAAEDIEDRDARTRVRWFALGDAGPAGDVTDELDDYAGWQVVRALGASSDEVWIELTEDGSWPYPPETPRSERDPRC